MISKNNKANALEEVIRINNFCSIVEFSNTEINQACHLMQKDSNFMDLEDTIQYFLAKKPVDMGEVTQLVTLVGVDDASALTVDNFSDFSVPTLSIF